MVGVFNNVRTKVFFALALEISPDGTYNFKVLFRLEDFISVCLFLGLFVLHLFPSMVCTFKHTYTHISCTMGKTKNKRLSLLHFESFALMIILYGAKLSKMNKTQEERNVYKEKKKHFTSGQTCILCFESNKKKSTANRTTHALHFIEIVCLCLFSSFRNHSHKREYTSTHHSRFLYRAKKKYLHSNFRLNREKKTPHMK